LYLLPSLLTYLFTYRDRKSRRLRQQQQQLSLSAGENQNNNCPTDFIWSNYARNRWRQR